MIALIYYIVFFFLILRFTVTLFNFISNPKLGHAKVKSNDFVSILVPVRNEVHRVTNLIDSIKELDYRNFEVILLDDNSTDGTFEFCKALIADDDRFAIERGAPLPKDWLGKNFACHQLAKLAKGRFLLFIDADETVAPDLLHNIVHRMKIYRLQLLSLFTNQLMFSWGERSVVPLMHFILLNLLPLRLVQLTKNPAFSAASGQCMIFEASDYHQNEWHKQVRSSVVEDIEIMKLMKGTGKKTDALLANGMIFCRMYGNFNEAINGFSKNLLAAFGYSVAGLMVFLILLIGGPIFVFLTADFHLTLFMCALIILSRIMISLAAQQSVFYNILLHPSQMVSFTFIALLSIKRYLTKTTFWKGRRV